MIPAVGYIRMSTDKQDKSPDQQRHEITALAKRDGYEILRWYFDGGISGDLTEKRRDFQQMINDAARGDFQAILAWDQDRFGRFDSIESGYWIHPLRKAGVCLVTVVQGKIDWNSFEGRILYHIQQEGKHGYLRDLSFNVCRGLREKAKQGKWPNGTPPFGFRATTNIGAPIQAIRTSHAKHIRPDRQQTHIKAFMRHEFLQIDDCTKLGEQFACPLGNRRIGHARDAASLAAEKWLEYDVLTQPVETLHGLVDGLVRLGTRHGQTGRLEFGQSQVFIDRDFDRFGRVHYQTATRL